MLNNSLLRISAVCILLVSEMYLHAQPKVVGYIPNAKAASAIIDYGKLTHVNIAFENPVDASGTMSFNYNNTAIILNAKAKNVKVLVSIGGGGIEGNSTVLSRYANLLKDANRAAFVQKLLDYVIAHNLDGIDVDLEGSAIDNNYGKFITDLYNKFHPAGKLVTAALGATPYMGGGRVPESAIPYFDFINIMAYDLKGPWSKENPGQHSPLEWAQSTLQFWVGRGLPASKAIVGVPFYGYGFYDDYNTGGYTYAEIVKKYPGAENSDFIGDTIWYNGIPAIKAKVDFALQNGGGIMIWELTQDTHDSTSLLNVIDETIKSSMPVNIPEAPSLLTCKSFSSTILNIKWKDNSTSEYQFRLQRSTNGTVWNDLDSMGMNTTSFTDANLLPNTKYYYRIRSENHLGSSDYSDSAFAVTMITDPVNIALNRSAEASSLEIPNFPASYVVDGNSTTRWSSLYTDPQWVCVDLLDTFNINRIGLLWEAAYAVSYEIQTSFDKENWTTIYSQDSSSGGNESIDVEGTARYVRMLGKKRNTEWGYSLFEFQIWGTCSKDTCVSPSLPPVRIKEIDIKPEVTAYPNPFVDKVTLNSSTLFNRVECFDIAGRLMMSKTFSVGVNEYVLRTDKFERGSYIVRITSSGKVNSIQILK